MLVKCYRAESDSECDQLTGFNGPPGRVWFTVEYNEKKEELALTIVRVKYFTSGKLLSVLQLTFSMQSLIFDGLIRLLAN